MGAIIRTSVLLLGLRRPRSPRAIAELADQQMVAERAIRRGYQLAGGYAEFTVADQHYGFTLPAAYGDAEAAPLLCAGLIGYRSLVLAGMAHPLNSLWAGLA